MLRQPVRGHIRGGSNESLMWSVRTTADGIVVSDVLVPPQHRAIEEDTGADSGVTDVGH